MSSKERVVCSEHGESCYNQGLKEVIKRNKFLDAHYGEIISKCRGFARTVAATLNESGVRGTAVLMTHEKTLDALKVKYARLVGSASGCYQEFAFPSVSGVGYFAITDVVSVNVVTVLPGVEEKVFSEVQESFEGLIQFSVPGNNGDTLGLKLVADDGHGSFVEVKVVNAVDYALLQLKALQAEVIPFDESRLALPSVPLVSKKVESAGELFLREYNDSYHALNRWSDLRDTSIGDNVRGCGPSDLKFFIDLYTPVTVKHIAGWESAHTRKHYYSVVNDLLGAAGVTTYRELHNILSNEGNKAAVKRYVSGHWHNDQLNYILNILIIDRGFDFFESIDKVIDRIQELGLNFKTRKPVYSADRFTLFVNEANKPR